MIHLQPLPLAADVGAGLNRLQRQVDGAADYPARVQLAKALFGRRNRTGDAIFGPVRATLSRMCAGARRCMYCEDSAADEVEHHRPRNLYPELAFRWSNYLYACGPCNRPKNNRFSAVVGGRLVDVTRRRGAPVVPPPAGRSGLIDPRSEDPLQYMKLDIAGSSFLFVATPPEGTVEFERAQYTIGLLGLNARADLLAVARREAYDSYRARLREYVPCRDTLLSDAIRRMQHPTVWREMQRQRADIPELDALFQEAPEALAW